MTKQTDKPTEQKQEKVDLEELRREIIGVLHGIYDPEIPVNIYDLGLIYEINISDDCMVHITMTLTAPGCPVAQTFPGTVADAIRSIQDVKDVDVELVWEPPWTQERMSEIARIQLGWGPVS